MYARPNQIFDKMRRQKVYLEKNSDFWKMIWENLDNPKCIMLTRNDPRYQSLDEWAAHFDMTTDEIIEALKQAKYDYQRKTKEEKEEEIMQGWKEHYQLQQAVSQI